jgi:hypothetical protein
MAEQSSNHGTMHPSATDEHLIFRPYSSVDKIMEASEVYWRNAALKYVKWLLNSSKTDYILGCRINARLLGTNFHVTIHSSIMDEISSSHFMIFGNSISARLASSYDGGIF